MVASTPSEDEESTPSRPTVTLTAKNSMPDLSSDEDLLLVMAYGSSIHNSVLVVDGSFLDASHSEMCTVPPGEVTGLTNPER